jgi:hypothetical protein
MSLKSMKKGRGMTRLAAAAVAGGIVVALLPGTPAFALGNNRNVQRSCGWNYVGSGYNGSEYWAETSRASGNCLGRLSAGFELENGQRSARKYGDSNNVRTTWKYQEPLYLDARLGLHWGCDDCNITYT